MGHPRSGPGLGRPLPQPPVGPGGFEKPVTCPRLCLVIGSRLGQATRQHVPPGLPTVSCCGLGRQGLRGEARPCTWHCRVYKLKQKARRGGWVTRLPACGPQTGAGSTSSGSAGQSQAQPLAGPAAAGPAGQRRWLLEAAPTVLGPCSPTWSLARWSPEQTPVPVAPPGEVRVRGGRGGPGTRPVCADSGPFIAEARCAGIWAQGPA